MSKALIAAILAVGGSIVMAADASAYERRGTFYGPYGGRWDTHVSRHCYGDVCRIKRHVVGPHGRVWTRRATVRRTPNGWERYGEAYGPYGRSKFGGSGSCHNRHCTYSGGRSGPYGRSNWSGSFQRY